MDHNSGPRGIVQLMKQIKYYRSNNLKYYFNINQYSSCCLLSDAVGLVWNEVLIILNYLHR